MCNNETCYKESLKRGQLCSPAFSSDNPSPNMKNYFMTFFVFWIILVLEPAINMLSRRQLFSGTCGFSMKTKNFVGFHALFRKTKNIIIWIYPRLLFLMLFSIPTLYFTIKGANKKTFCLMNVTEKICKKYRREMAECLDASDFTGSAVISGNGYCTFTTNLNFYISEYDQGIDGNAPNNIDAVC